MRRGKDLVKFRAAACWSKSNQHVISEVGCYGTQYPSIIITSGIVMSKWCYKRWRGYVIWLVGAVVQQQQWKWVVQQYQMIKFIVNAMVANIGYNSWWQVPIGNGPATHGYLVLQVHYNVTAPSYRADGEILDWLPEAMSLELISIGLPNLAGHYRWKCFSWCWWFWECTIFCVSYLFHTLVFLFCDSRWVGAWSYLQL
jgi:hypothetical protein